MQNSLVAVAVLITCLTTSVNAEIVVDIMEQGDNVVATYSGSINLDATLGFAQVSSVNDNIFAAAGIIQFTSENVWVYDTNVFGWTTYGGKMSNGLFGGNWDQSQGDAFGNFTSNQIGLPVGYLSGDFISGSATEFNATIETMGFDLGSFTTTFSNGAVSDSLTINVGNAIPEPASTFLLGIHLVAGLSIRRRRRRKKVMHPFAVSHVAI